MSAGPASLRARFLTTACRRLVRPLLAVQRDPATGRARFLRSARWLAPDPPGARFLPDRFGEGRVPGLWASGPGCDAGGVILYLHGGAFVMGSPRTHRAMAARLAAAAGMRAVLPRYRLAPEHPFPAALEDALAVWRALLARGWPPQRLAVAGDSAGGGLALALVAEAARLGLPGPAAVVGFSPFLDLTMSGASWQENAGRDALLPAERRGEVAALYLQGAAAEDPRASPLWACWQAPPPVLLFAARSEVLRDDSVRMVARLRAAGGRAELRLAGDLPHVWPWMCPWMPEACATLAEAGAFLAGCLPAHD